MATDRQEPPATAGPIEDRSTLTDDVMADKRQQDFAWTRGDQLQLLRKLQLPQSNPSNDGRTVSGAACKAMLRAIDDRAGLKGWCFIPVPLLAIEAGVSLRVARRALDALRELALLTEEATRVARSPRLRLKIQWQNLEELVAPTATECHSGTVQSATRTRQSATRTRQSATVAPSYPSARSAQEAPPPNAARPAADDRLAAAAALESCGVEWPAQALDVARQFHTEATIAALIDHYRQQSAGNGWGPGALVARLKNPVAAIDRGWPPAKPQARAAIHREREELQQAAARAENQQHREESAATDAQLEHRHGPRLDALPPDQLQQLAETTLNPYQLAAWRKKPNNRAVRRVLLRAVSGQPLVHHQNAKGTNNEHEHAPAREAARNDGSPPATTRGPAVCSAAGECGAGRDRRPVAAADST